MREKVLQYFHRVTNYLYLLVTRSLNDPCFSVRKQQNQLCGEIGIATLPGVFNTRTSRASCAFCGYIPLLFRDFQLMFGCVYAALQTIA